MVSRILMFILYTSSLCYCCCIQDYTVPEPIIELLNRKGFSVRIPHSDGITLFAFHGKINEEMSFLEAGTFSKDICVKTGDYWIFEDRHTKLNVGDKIYYWLFVIKNGLGYRYEDGEFTVKENTPFRKEETTEESTTIQTTVESSTIDIRSETATKPSNDVAGILGTSILMGICERTILNITDSLLKLQSEVSSLKDTNEILKDISEKHPASARTLKIEGRFPVNEDALSTVKGIIKQKLALSIEIVKAERNKDGSITFETASLDDKVQIIKTAKEKLRYSKIYLTY